VRLVWDSAGRHYTWHITLEDGIRPALAPGGRVAAVDLGDIRPATLTDGNEAVVVCTRRLRATYQYTSKRLAELRSKQDRKQKGSRRWKALQQRKSRFLAQQNRPARDIKHKVSRAVVNWATEREVGTLAVGDVRDVANGKRLKKQEQQKTSLWSHGCQRQYITYKAAAVGIRVVLVVSTTPARPVRPVDTSTNPVGACTTARSKRAGLWVTAMLWAASRSCRAISTVQWGRCSRHH
jgi:putative transposase